MKTITRSCAFLIVILIFALLLSSCDSGLKYVKIEVETLPEKTFYYVGEDAALQFDGGTVKLTTLDGSTSIEELLSYSYRQDDVAGGEERYISSDVNFNLPGEYTVTIHQTKDLSCQYAIEVRNR